MPFRRQSFDPDLAGVRSATPADVTAIARLLNTVRHYLAHFAGEELPELLGKAPAVVLTTRDGAIWAAAVCGIPIGGATWLRQVPLVDLL